MSDKARRVPVGVKRCDSKVNKPNGRERTSATLFMIGTLFFWYYALNQMWFFIYNELGFTMTGSIFGTFVSVSSGLVYAYLVYGLIRIESFNLKRSIIVLLFMVVFSVIIVTFFPIPAV